MNKVKRDSAKLHMSNSNNLPWLTGGGELGKLIRRKDWSKTPLGPIESWPSSLKTMLGVVLGSRFPMLIWWGPDLLHLYNDAYRPILRDKHPSSLGTPAAKVWSEVWDVAGPMAKSVQNGGPATWTEDLQLFINNGAMAEETYFTFSYSPIPDDSGKIAGILNTVQETTSKVQGDRQISMLHDLAARASEAKSEAEAYQAILLALAINDLDIPFSLLYKLDKSTDQAQLIGKTGLDKYSGHAAPAIIQISGLEDSKTWPLEKSLRGSKEVLVDDLSHRFGTLPLGRWNARPQQAIIKPLVHTGKSTPDAWLIAGISPHRELDDAYKRFFQATTDQIVAVIANARAYEAEKRRAEELAELDEAKTVFFSNVSHEFRTPLTLMLGPLEEGLNDTSLPKEHHTQLELIHRNALRLQKLVNSLLDFSGLEAGRTKALFQPIDLAGFTRELANTFKPAMLKAGLQYKVTCPPLKHKVYVDYGQWEKIVLNLLSNALKFTLKGSVHVSVAETSKHAILKIHDTGSGIPKDELPHLFERFHRVTGARARTIEGSGIGLALVSELVKLHGGTISAKSVPRKGTTFTVGLPFGTDHLPQDQVKKLARREVVTIGNARAYLNEAMDWAQTDKPETARTITAEKLVKSKWDQTILVVDDNSDMREYIRRTINSNTSLRVMACNNGLTALAAIKKKRPDLIITDIMMPEMDGFELVRTLRQNPVTATIPIIYLSARAGEEAKIEGIGEGVEDYLVKPFSANELVARVNTHLNLALIRNKSKSK